MNTFLRFFTFLCVFTCLATFTQAQNVGIWNPNTTSTPHRVGVGTTNPDNALHVKINTTTHLAKFEQGASGGKDAGIYIKGARNGCTGCDISYIDFANFDNNTSASGEYIMSRISGGMDATNTKAGHIKFKTNNGTSLAEAMRITSTGKVRVGSVSTASNNYKLFVEKGILTEKVKVALASSADWADYVFAPDYQRNSIDDVAQFIAKNKHLPNVPSAKEVVANGIDVAQMDATLLRQIEELWLHVIDLKETNEQLIEKNQQLSKQVEGLLENAK